MDWSGSGQRPVSGYCESGNEPSIALSWRFIDWLASHEGFWSTEIISINKTNPVSFLIEAKGIFIRNQINLLKSTGYVMHQQFNIQQLHVLYKLYLCILYLSENKQRLVPLIS